MNSPFDPRAVELAGGRPVHPIGGESWVTAGPAGVLVDGPRASVTYPVTREAGFRPGFMPHDIADARMIDWLRAGDRSVPDWLDNPVHSRRLRAMVHVGLTTERPDGVHIRIGTWGALIKPRDGLRCEVRVDNSGREPTEMTRDELLALVVRREVVTRLTTIDAMKWGAHAGVAAGVEKGAAALLADGPRPTAVESLVALAHELVSGSGVELGQAAGVKDAPIVRLVLPLRAATERGDVGRIAAIVRLLLALRIAFWRGALIPPLMECVHRNRSGQYCGVTDGARPCESGEYRRCPVVRPWRWGGPSGVIRPLENCGGGWYAHLVVVWRHADLPFEMALVVLSAEEAALHMKLLEIADMLVSACANGVDRGLHAAAVAAVRRLIDDSAHDPRPLVEALVRLVQCQPELRARATPIPERRARVRRSLDDLLAEAHQGVLELFGRVN